MHLAATPDEFVGIERIGPFARMHMISLGQTYTEEELRQLIAEREHARDYIEI